MTRIETFAAAALTAILANPDPPLAGDQTMLETVWEWADAMEAEARKREKNTGPVQYSYREGA